MDAALKVETRGPATLGAWLGGALLVLLPAFWLPGFHDGFVQSKQVLLLTLGLAAYALSAWSRRGQEDTLALPRALFALAALWLVGRSVLAADGFPHHLAPWLPLLVAPWLFLEIGATLAARPGGGRRLLGLLFASALPVAVIGCLRRDLGWFAALPDRADVGLAATIGNSNALAEYAAPIAAAALPAALMGRHRLLPMLGGLAAVWLVFRSDSRGGLLALAAGGAVAAWLVLRDRDTPKAAARRGGLALLLLLGLLIGGLSFLPAARPARDRVLSIFDVDHPTNAVRLDVWAGTLDAWRESPVAGVGAGRFPFVFPEHRRAREWRLSGADTRVESPHQEPLWILCEGGLPGALIALALLGLGLVAMRRLRRDGEREARTLAASGAAALTAFAAVAMVRSPLHHPSGVLAPAALLGAVMALRPLTPLPRGGSRLAAGILHLLVLAWFLLSLLEMVEDRRLERALVAHRSVETGLEAGDAAALPLSLETASLGVRDLEQAPVQSVPRLFRTALLARDLARARRALVQAGLGEKVPLMVDERVVARLLDRILELAPLHAGAIVARAELDLALGQVATAVHRLEDAVSMLPRAPRLRENIASIFDAAGQRAEARRWLEDAVAHDTLGDAALRRRLGLANLSLGSDPQSFGRLLEAPRHPDREGALDAAESRHASGDARGASEILLLHLADHPGDVAALHFLAELALGALKDDPQVGGVAPRAIARQRLLTARDALTDGELRVASINLRQALGKDPELLDAWVIRAGLHAREGSLEAVLGDLEHLRKAGVDARTLRRSLRRLPGLAALLDAGKLDSALAPG